MAIAITTPTSNLDDIKSTMDIVSDTTFYNYSIATSGVCQILSTDFYGYASKKAGYSMI